MKPSSDGKRCTFNEREQNTYGFPESFHVNELVDKLPALYQQRDRWYETACEPTPYNSERGERQALFNQANDLGRLLNRLTTYIPPIEVNEADLFLRSLEED